MHSSGPYSIWQTLGLALPFPIAYLVAVAAGWMCRAKIPPKRPPLPPEKEAEQDDLQEIENRTW